MTHMAEQQARRIPAAERRELVLQAAGVEFGRTGYAGTTTDQVAKAAGISQPYVVRMFGTKEQLFLETLERALAALLGEFRAEIAAHAASGEPADTLPGRLGRAYVQLASDRGIHLVIMQGNMMGDEPVIGACARKGFLRVYTFFRDEVGFSPEEATTFLAHGMLFNTLLAVGMPELREENPVAAEFVEAAFGPKLDVLVRAAGA